MAEVDAESTADRQMKTNTRQAKANDTYYLLKRTEVPTIIVECGFLSNPEEAAKLVESKVSGEACGSDRRRNPCLYGKLECSIMNNHENNIRKN